MRHIAKRLFKMWLPILMMAAAIIVRVLAELALPDYTADIVDIGIAQASGSQDSNFIFTTGITMLAIATVAMLATVFSSFLSARVGANLARELRHDIFDKVLHFSKADMEEFSTASLITRCTNDIQQIQMLVAVMFRIILLAPLMGVGGILKVMGINNSMTWIIALSVGMILTLVIVLFAFAIPKFLIIQKVIDKLNLVSREILSGLPVIRAFGTQKTEEERFDKVNKDLTKLNLFINRIMAFMAPVMMFVMNGVGVLIVWFGAEQVAQNALEVGDIMAFIQYATQIIMAFFMITMISIMLPRAAVSVKRVGEILNATSTVQDKKEVAVLPVNSPRNIEFKNVCFKFEGAQEYTLKNINFTAKAGETTAIIGGTGSGKSTIINLIPRFFDVTEGEILINDIDIRDLSQHSLRDILGFVPQKGVLFSGTIESNIKFANTPIDDAMMVEAAKIAQAENFIEEKDDKYDEYISQGGSNVSGGQRQRLAIARAIAKKPDVYIFDDSFSALDYKTDVNLRRALNEITQEATVIIVAQRISTIMQAEQIIVISDGEIAGKGTHDELMQHCEVYKEIAVSQLAKEEM